MSTAHSQQRRQVLPDPTFNPPIEHIQGGGGSQGGISTSLFILLVSLNALMFLVEMFIMAVRIAIARKKWSELHPRQHVLDVDPVPASAEKV